MIELSTIESLKDEVSSTEYSYRQRLRIESAVFRLAKGVAKRVLDFDLHGFSIVEREALDAKLASNSAPGDVKRFFDLSFEIRALLSLLSSGDAYRAGELLDVAPGGRKEALAMLARSLGRLSDYARRVVT